MANRLKELREAQGLSLVELAERAGTSNQQISHLELGKRQFTVGWLNRLAAALNCHPWAIVSTDAPVSKEEVELLKLYRSLSTDGRRALLVDLRIDSKPPRTARLRGV